MVNEDLPPVKGPDQPFAIRYEKQLQEKGIPDWAPAESFVLTRALSGNAVSESTVPQTKATGESTTETEPLTRKQKRAARRKNKAKEQGSETPGLEEVPQQ